jgi:hypothetical protein
MAILDGAVESGSSAGRCKYATVILSSSWAWDDSPDPPQVGQGSTWVPVVVMLIDLPPPHRQHLAIDPCSKKEPGRITA